MRSFAIATLLAAAYAVNAASITVEVGPNGTVRLVSSSSSEIIWIYTVM